MIIALTNNLRTISFDFAAGTYSACNMLNQVCTFALSQSELQGRLQSLEQQGWKRN
jgi:hypothetical protein